MSKWIMRRGGLALCLAAALTIASLGCHPANSSAPASSAGKAGDSKQNPKDKPGGAAKHEPGD